MIEVEQAPDFDKITSVGKEELGHINTLSRLSTPSSLLSTLPHILLQTPHHTNTGKENWDAAELDFTELQALVLDELSSRDGVLRMVCKVTDVEGREGALAKSLIPNPFAGKGEKQFKETRGNMKSLYPTATYKWFMINIKPSYAGKVQGAISSFGGRSAYKMIVCDTNYKAVLEAEVDKSMLPSQFGGSLPASCFPTG